MLIWNVFIQIHTSFDYGGIYSVSVMYIFANHEIGMLINKCEMIVWDNMVRMKISVKKSATNGCIKTLQ